MAVMALGIALILGLLAKQVNLPPLVGYLVAGFALNIFGFDASDTLQTVANLGVTLLLFTIGLKINLKDLIKVEIWGSAISHLGLWMLTVAPLAFGLSLFALSDLLNIAFTELAILVFAFSFSSTVCAIKILEDASELKSRHSNLAISVLIIQDIFAVLFMVFATGKAPSLWALALVALIPLRPLILTFADRLGHGELVPLAGFVLALGGYALFDLVGLKGDLGALGIGMLMANTKKADELYKSLISFKEIFLIAFFLTIGLSGLPDLKTIGVALLLSLLLPLKFILFFFVFSAFSFRVRTALLSALLLSNFSEFGLIVTSLSVSEGLLHEEWLLTLALVMAFSFVISSFLYRYAHRIYAMYKSKLARFQRKRASIKNMPTRALGAQVMIVGLGRVGVGAYLSLKEEWGDKLWGVEIDRARVPGLNKLEVTNIVVGDGDDIEFWEAQEIESIKLIMLAMPSIDEILVVVRQLQTAGYRGRISTVARYDDERERLLAMGVDVAFNYYSEVGAGLANESCHLLR